MNTTIVRRMSVSRKLKKAAGAALKISMGLDLQNVRQKKGGDRKKTEFVFSLMQS
jgi:hypothetical protein